MRRLFLLCFGVIALLTRCDDGCRSCPERRWRFASRQSNDEADWRITRQTRNWQPMIEAHDTWAREIAKAGIDCNKADGDEDKRRCNDPRKADLSGADLSEANLCGKDLRYANLTGADLSDSDLSRTNLTGARLVATDLENANMTDANLAEADLSCALYEPKSGGPEIRGPT